MRQGCLPPRLGPCWHWVGHPCPTAQGLSLQESQVGHTGPMGKQNMLIPWLGTLRQVQGRP